MIRQSEKDSGTEVEEEAIGDAAYGEGATRQALADVGYTLIDKAPGRR